MEKLKHNLVKIYGKRGEDWLAELPLRIEQLQYSWGLSKLKPLPNLSYSYVLKGMQGNIPVILKLNPDTNLIDKEAKALNAFEGFGAISVLGHKEGILLLERAIPGDLLKNSFPKEKRIEVACKVMERLHQAPVPSKEGFPDIEEWLSAVDKEWDLPANRCCPSGSFMDRAYPIQNIRMLPQSCSASCSRDEQNVHLTYHRQRMVCRQY